MENKIFHDKKIERIYFYLRRMAPENDFKKLCYNTAYSLNGSNSLRLILENPFGNFLNCFSKLFQSYKITISCCVLSERDRNESTIRHSYDMLYPRLK